METSIKNGVSYEKSFKDRKHSLTRDLFQNLGIERKSEVTTNEYDVNVKDGLVDHIWNVNMMLQGMDVKKEIPKIETIEVAT